MATWQVFERGIAELEARRLAKRVTLLVAAAFVLGVLVGAIAFGR
jgi:hypothetical protein